MAEYAEILKYLVGAIPPLLVMAWKWWKDRQKDKIMDHNSFLKELESMHDRVLKYKTRIMKLEFENESLQKLKISLNGTITELKGIITKYRERFGQLED